MEDLVKVVVFEVDVPKEEDIKNSFVYSKPFTIKIDTKLETKWELGCNLKYQDETFVAVFLKCSSKLLDPLDVQYSFHLISSNKSTEIAGISYYHQFTSSIPSRGPQKFISHKQLQDNSSDLFISGKKIRFVAKIFCVGGISPSKISSSSEWLKKLYETMSHSDLIIKSSNHTTFKAHKGIICARSEVLNRMFSNQMKENMTGVVEIADSSEVVKELIHFIYCGDFADDFNNISHVDIDLYNAAERYELKGLKFLCLKSIYMRLEVENSLEIAEFAKLFNLKKLYSCCLIMIYANFALISQSDEWKRLQDITTISDDIMLKSHKLYGNELWTSDDFQ